MLKSLRGGCQSRPAACCAGGCRSATRARGHNRASLHGARGGARGAAGWPPGVRRGDGRTAVEDRDSLAPVNLRRRRRNLADLAYDELRRGIYSLRLRPGQRLYPGDLARAMHISVTPVKLALSRLAAEGLIEARLRQGSYSRASPTPLRELTAPAPSARGSG